MEHTHTRAHTRTQTDLLLTSRVSLHVRDVDADDPERRYWCRYNYWARDTSVISAGQREEPDQATHAAMIARNRSKKSETGQLAQFVTL